MQFFINLDGDLLNHYERTNIEKAVEAAAQRVFGSAVQVELRLDPSADGGSFMTFNDASLDNDSALLIQHYIEKALNK